MCGAGAVDIDDVDPVLSTASGDVAIQIHVFPWQENDALVNLMAVNRSDDRSVSPRELMRKSFNIPMGGWTEDDEGRIVFRYSFLGSSLTHELVDEALRIAIAEAQQLDDPDGSAGPFSAEDMGDTVAVEQQMLMAFVKADDAQAEHQVMERYPALRNAQALELLARLIDEARQAGSHDLAKVFEAKRTRLRILQSGI